LLDSPKPEPQEQIRRVFTALPHVIPLVLSLIPSCVPVHGLGSQALLELDSVPDSALGAFELQSPGFHTVLFSIDTDYPALIDLTLIG
jgi:hypothetical protein